LPIRPSGKTHRRFRGGVHFCRGWPGLANLFDGSAVAAAGPRRHLGRRIVRRGRGPLGRGRQPVPPPTDKSSTVRNPDAALRQPRVSDGHPQPLDWFDRAARPPADLHYCFYGRDGIRRRRKVRPAHFAPLVWRCTARRHDVFESASAERLADVVEPARCCC